MPYSFNPLSGLGLDQSIPLDGAGKIPSDYLPSYVDDVVEYANLAGFPATGETGKIYVAIDTGFTYRWSGSVYIQINSLTGTFAADAGTAAAPSVSIGTADNGLYAPAEDQVAISSNGVGRLFIDASGNIKVSTGEIFNTSATGYIRIAGGDDGGSGANILAFGQSHGSAAGRLVLTAVGSESMQFGAGGAERMRLDSSGRLGLGTSSPSAPLHIEVAGSGTADAGAVLIKNASSSYGRSLLEFRSNNNFGRVSLYGGAPGTGAGYGTFDLHVWDNSGISNRFIHVEGESYSNHLSFWTGSAAIGTNAERVRIDNLGRVGIGTTSPGAPLEVIGTAGTISARASTSVSSLAIQIYNNGTDSFIDSTAYGAGSGGAIVFRRNGTTELGRWDTSGRLLVGTSSARSNFFNTTASAALQIEGLGGTGDSRRIAIVSSENGGLGGGGIVLAHQRSGSIGGNTIVQNGDQNGAISFQGNDGAQFVETARIEACVDGTPGANDMPGRLVFSSTPSGSATPVERMRISQNGAFGFFSTTTAAFNVVSSGSSAADAAFRVIKSGSSTDFNSGTACMVIRQDGDLENTNNSYTGLSDVKLKENIVDANSQWEDIKALRVRNYNFKPETGHDGHRQIGLIAQELEPICPHLVDESPDSDEEGNDLGTVTKSVNYSVLYMKAVKALQEAMERIETLEAKVAALEGV